MKNRYWLFRRNGVFYVQDAQTRHRESLHTSDRTEAERIRDARNQVAERPNLGIAMAKAYLTAHDPKIAVRTWQDVLDEFSRRGKPQTREHRRTVSARKPFDLIRNQRILETTATDFLAVMQKGGVMSGRGLVTTTPSTVPPASYTWAAGHHDRGRDGTNHCLSPQPHRPARRCRNLRFDLLLPPRAW